MTPIDLVVEEHFHRAAPGGMGGTKAAGNYSPVSASICCFWTATSALRVFACQAVAVRLWCCNKLHTGSWLCSSTSIGIVLVDYLEMRGKSVEVLTQAVRQRWQPAWPKCCSAPCCYPCYISLLIAGPSCLYCLDAGVDNTASSQAKWVCRCCVLGCKDRHVP